MVQERISKFKRLPNTQRYFASGLTTTFCLFLFLIVYLMLEAAGFEISTMGFVIGVVFAEIVATVIFYAWVNFARKLEHKER